MRYLHTMVRVSDLDASLDFYCNKLGLQEVRRIENEKGRFTLVFLATPDDAKRIKAEADTALAAESPVIELTYNWDEKGYTRRPQFRASRLSGERHLRALRKIDEGRRHHQPAAA